MMATYIFTYVNWAIYLMSNVLMYLECTDDIGESTPILQRNSAYLLDSFHSCHRRPFVLFPEVVFWAHFYQNLHLLHNWN